MRLTLIGCLLPLLSLTVSAQELGKDLGDKSEIRGATATDSQIIEGIKEALTIGAKNAVPVAGVENGFWSNDQIKIPLPEKMAGMENGLRMAGQGINMDQFQLGMNRAAEMAAPSCEAILLKAIAAMTISDARGVLNGGSKAATEYLEKAMLPWMAKAARPYVEAGMAKYYVKQRYMPISLEMQGLTMGQAGSFDVDRYMVNATLNGLLVLIAADEQKIRNDPNAQVTPLLKTVFAKR